MLTRAVVTFVLTFLIIFVVHTIVEAALNRKGYHLRVSGSLLIYVLVSAALITFTLV